MTPTHAFSGFLWTISDGDIRTCEFQCLPSRYQDNIIYIHFGPIPCAAPGVQVLHVIIINAIPYYHHATPPASIILCRRVVITLDKPMPLCSEVLDVSFL